jgi:hypothetical protein
VNFARVAKIVKDVFRDSFGEYKGIFVEHNKLKTRACSNQQYVNDLAHIISMIAFYKDENGDITDNDFVEILFESKSDKIMARQVFVVRKTFAMSEVEFAFENNTRADGYCMWWMTLQQQIRTAFGPGCDCAHLRAQDSALTVDGDLVPHIQEYIDCVNYREKDSQELALTQLTTVMSRARDFPNLTNPFNLWGNSKLCRFINTRLMLFCLETAKKINLEGEPHCIAQLSIVNHALGDMYQDGAPQFTRKQMTDMVASPNYCGFMRSHFFTLENPIGVVESECMDNAYREWMLYIVETVQGMSETDLALVKALDSNNRHHPIIDLSDDSDNEADLDILIDTVEDCVEVSQQLTSATPKTRFSGEISFHRNAPFRDEQRETLLETVCFIF